MKALREEILDHNGVTSMQNSKDEKLSQGEMSDFQSFCRATQEQAFLEAGIVDTHEVHGKKLLKRKPDKALPCPRCESLDTKFCYFNNYNVNQPRHFCRKCRRYWTAGGVLRNVPMGAGCRRNKHPTTHNHVDANRIVSSRGSTRSNSETELLHLHKLVFPLDVEPLASVDNLSATSTMLSFGQHTPPCEAMEVLMQQNTIKGSLNEQYASPAYANFELDRNLLQRKGNDTHASSNSCLEASSIPASSGIHNMKGTANEEHEVKGDKPGLHTKLWRRFDAAKETAAVTSAFYSTTTALHFIDSARENSMAVASDCTDTLRQHFDPPKEKVKPMASDCASQCIDTANSTEVSASTPNWALWNGFPGGMWARPPWPFAPTSVWGPPASDWVSACWHMPWLLAAVSPSSSTIRRPGQAGSEAEGRLLVPKTLRIDDPVEAARSSIWTTLGLDKDPGSLSVKEGSTISFPYKTDTQDREESKNQSQHLNPAALSRSLTFNETN